ncbi:hypothetical protein Dimus_009397 [Dionaea muscipula]
MVGKWGQPRRVQAVSSEVPVKSVSSGAGEIPSVQKHGGCASLEGLDGIGNEVLKPPCLGEPPRTPAVTAKKDWRAVNPCKLKEPVPAVREEVSRADPSEQGIDDALQQGGAVLAQENEWQFVTTRKDGNKGFSNANKAIVTHQRFAILSVEQKDGAAGNNNPVAATQGFNGGYEIPSKSMAAAKDFDVDSPRLRWWLQWWLRWQQPKALIATAQTMVASMVASTTAVVLVLVRHSSWSVGAFGMLVTLATAWLVEGQLI